MPALFDGTAFERPVTCSACNKSMSDCSCPRDAQGEICLPADQDARVRREKRRAKWVTVVTGMDSHATDLKKLSKQLKATCSAGGSATEDGVEVQGDHRDKIVDLLKQMGYPAKTAGG